MKSHQLDLEQGESLRVGVHILTVLEIDEKNGEIVLQIEDPDGTFEIVSLASASAERPEPAFV